MGQFLGYANRNAASRREFPFLVDIQPKLLLDLPTTVVPHYATPPVLLASPLPSFALCLNLTATNIWH